MITPSTWFIKQEFEKRGYVVKTFDSIFLLLAEKDGKHFFTHVSKTVQQTTSYLICKNKYLTRQVMAQFGYPNPKFQLLKKDEPIVLSGLQFPVVIKPLLLSGGEDVALSITSVEEIEAYRKAHPQYSELLLEETLKGNDTRVLIIRGKFFAAVQRRPASVVGDGTHTVEALVRIENERRAKLKEDDARNNAYTTDLELIVFDDEARHVLIDAGYTDQSVVPNGIRIEVRKNSNVSTGGSSIDVTELVCKETQALCEKLAKDLRMTTVGIDIMTEDLSKPLDSNPSWGIVEVNSSPGLDLHILTDEGQRRNPVPLIVDEIEEYLQKQEK